MNNFTQVALLQSLIADFTAASKQATVDNSSLLDGLTLAQVLALITPAGVGLDQVVNKPIVSAEEIAQATSVDKYLRPADLAGYYNTLAGLNETGLLFVNEASLFKLIADAPVQAQVVAINATEAAAYEAIDVAYYIDMENAGVAIRTVDPGDQSISYPITLFAESTLHPHRLYYEVMTRRWWWVDENWVFTQLGFPLTQDPIETVGVDAPIYPIEGDKWFDTTH